MRTITLLAAAILMVVALMLIISYRPPPVALSGVAAAGDTSQPTESMIPASPQTAVQPAPGPRRASGAEIARSAAAADTLVAAAGEKWLRSTELLPPGVVTADNARDAAVQLRKAVIIADSARRDVALARRQAEVVLRLSREAGSRTAFRLGVLYTALDRYLKSMRDDAEDRYAFYAKSEVSVKAVLLGDEAESETQQNVANSYLRSSEDRQAGIKRLEQQVHEALGNLENSGR